MDATYPSCYLKKVPHCQIWIIKPGSKLNNAISTVKALKKKHHIRTKVVMSLVPERHFSSAQGG